MAAEAHGGCQEPAIYQQLAEARQPSPAPQEWPKKEALPPASHRWADGQLCGRVATPEPPSAERLGEATPASLRFSGPCVGQTPAWEEEEHAIKYTNLAFCVLQSDSNKSHFPYILAGLFPLGLRGHRQKGQAPCSPRRNKRGAGAARHQRAPRTLRLCGEGQDGLSKPAPAGLSPRPGRTGSETPRAGAWELAKAVLPGGLVVRPPPTQGSGTSPLIRPGWPLSGEGKGPGCGQSPGAACSVRECWEF